MIRDKILTWNTKELLAPNGNTLCLGVPALYFFTQTGSSSALPTPNKGEFRQVDSAGYQYVWECQDLDWSNAFSGTTATGPILVLGSKNTNTILSTSSMFQGCQWLQQFVLGSSGYPESNFRKVVSSDAMFAECSNLHTCGAAKGFTSALENCAVMYYGCRSCVNVQDQYQKLVLCNPRNHDQCFTGCTYNMEYIPASWGGSGNG